MNKYVIIGLIILITIIIVVSILLYIKKRKRQDFHLMIENLDRDKNLIISAPILSELSKVEAILKNEKLEGKYKEWQKRFYEIREDKVPEINDMIIELDLFTNVKDKEEFMEKCAKTHLEVFKNKENVENLLSEIREITLSEEKYRNIILKLKNKYRSFISEFKVHRSDYEDMETIVELQLENIEKRFQDFEKAMSNNEYDEVVHIVKALDAMVDHMSVIIVEIPNLILLAKRLIPKRIEEIEKIYEDMTKKGYSLEFLKIKYNIKETRKHIKDVMARIKVLNLEDCMFELKTILDYLDGTFNDFEKEKLSRKIYDETSIKFEKRLKRTLKIIEDMYSQMDDIKNMYSLKDKDIKGIDKVKLNLEKINSFYLGLVEKKDNLQIPFSDLIIEVDKLTIELNKLEEELNYVLKNLGSMYDDEVRAKEQLEEIEDLLKQCKIRIRTYKLPIIANNYFVELNEANEAILEIIKELDRKPIMIKVLNTRVDTARDLVLKLYNTTSDMIKKASLAEEAIVYGNKYRATIPEIDRALTNAENLFYQGYYQDSLNVSVKAIEEYDTRIHKYLTSVY